jgi:uncharacterized membrane protein YbhN (UPF0104 family)
VIRRLSRFAPVLFVGIALAGAAYAVGKHADELVQVLGRLSLLSIVGSTACGIAGVGLTFFMWREVLHGLGAPVPMVAAARVFFVSQLGKYIPGSVWPVMAQMEYGRRTNTGRRTMLTANALTIALSLTAGMIAAAVCLPFASTHALHRYAWVFLFLPVLILGLHPRVVPAMLDWIFRRIGRAPLDQRLPWGSVVRAIAWAFGSWLLLGLHLYVLLRGVGVTDWHAFPAAIGGFALAVTAGLLFVPAPAGAGIRDAVLIATLAAITDAPTAIAVGLASRVLLIVVDVLLAGVAEFGARVLPGADTVPPDPGTVGIQEPGRSGVSEP